MVIIPSFHYTQTTSFARERNAISVTNNILSVMAFKALNNVDGPTCPVSEHPLDLGEIFDFPLDSWPTARHLTASILPQVGRAQFEVIGTHNPTGVTDRFDNTVCQNWVEIVGENQRVNI